MSELKHLTNTIPIHERKLEFKVFPQKNNQLLVEGWLTDERMVDSFTPEGSIVPAGIIHRICTRFLLDGWPLAIVDAEAEMPIIPHDECRDTEESVKKVIGLKITSGYSEEILKLLGGIKSCFHMVHLLISMGNAATQGYWSNTLQKPMEPKNKSEEFPVPQQVLTSCWVWRNDGPRSNKLKRA